MKRESFLAVVKGCLFKSARRGEEIMSIAVHRGSHISIQYPQVEKGLKLILIPTNSEVANDCQNKLLKW